MPKQQRNYHNSTIDTRAFVLDNAAPMKPARFLLRGFRRPREVAAQALGKLEREVLNEIWRRGEVTVRDIYLEFDESIAYTESQIALLAMTTGLIAAYYLRLAAGGAVVLAALLIFAAASLARRRLPATAREAHP